MSTSKFRKKSAKFYLVGMCTLVSLGWIYLLFSDSATYEPREDPLAVADVSQHSPYVEEVAGQLSRDPIYVDPVLTGTIGRGVDTERVRSAIEDCETPVHLMVLATQGMTVEDKVLAARIADALDRDGVFLAFDESGRSLDVVRGLDLEGNVIFLPSTSAYSFNEEAVLDVIAEIDTAVHRKQESLAEQDSFVASPFVLGLFLGLSFAVPLWYVMKFIRWSARRDRSYLKGFRE